MSILKNDAKLFKTAEPERSNDTQDSQCCFQFTVPKLPMCTVLVLLLFSTHRQQSSPKNKEGWLSGLSGGVPG